MWRVPRVLSGVGSPEAVEERIRRTKAYDEERAIRIQVGQLPYDRSDDAIRDVNRATRMLEASLANAEEKAVLAGAIHDGSPVAISEADYREWGRTFIQNLSWTYIDRGEIVRANICICEVMRLDKEFTFWNNLEPSEQPSPESPSESSAKS